MHVERQITALRDMGCHLALDDFGTGYSSFSYLQKLQFDYIKIDGTFVEDILNNPVDQKMIKLIAEIGAEAGMETVAEYVQDAESMALLDRTGRRSCAGLLCRPPQQDARTQIHTDFPRLTPHESSPASPYPPDSICVSCVGEGQLRLPFSLVGFVRTPEMYEQPCHQQDQRRPHIEMRQ